jgi:hypothetical protein
VCCAAFRLGSLGKQGWFKFKGTAVLDYINAAIPLEMFQGLTGIPPGWLKPARKQLPLTELERQCTINWSVPRADLQQLLTITAGQIQEQTSDKVYMAGTGVHLLLQSKREEEGGKTSLGVYLQLTDYAHPDGTVCSARSALGCHYVTSRQIPGQEQMSVIDQYTAALTSRGWGIPGVITASTPAELEPHLVDGHLKLKATIRLIPG